MGHVLLDKGVVNGTENVEHVMIWVEMGKPIAMVPKAMHKGVNIAMIPVNKEQHKLATYVSKMVSVSGTIPWQNVQMEIV
jgi:hypothetical protein